MKRIRLLDSFAILAYLNKETGFETVKEALEQAQRIQQPALMNEFNVGEIYSILLRNRGKPPADEFLNNILPSLPIFVVSNTFESIIEAAEIKAQYPMSYADAFAVSTAIRMDAAVMTGDPEFKAVENLVTVEWLGKSKEST